MTPPRTRPVLDYALLFDFAMYLTIIEYENELVLFQFIVYILSFVGSMQKRQTDREKGE